MCNFLVPKLQLGNTLARKLQRPVSKRVEAGASTTIKTVPKLELGNERFVKGSIKAGPTEEKKHQPGIESSQTIDCDASPA